MAINLVLPACVRHLPPPTPPPPHPPQKIDKVLLQAEEMASKFVQLATPRDLAPELTLPVCV
jgi:hypothetical protein